MRSLFVLAVICISATTSLAQTNTNIIAGQDSSRRAITPAVPFLMIAPDARGGAMGDVGAALSPTANASHYNIGKLAFIEEDYGINLSYSPWMGKIVPDMFLGYLSGYYKIDELQAVSSSLRYFDLGEIQFMDRDGNESAPPFNPQELAFDLGYSRKLSENLGLGVTARYIHSDLAGEGSAANLDARAGQSLAADIGLYFNNPNMRVGGTESELAFAAVISNIGNKITYLDEERESFIPTNLRLGTAYTAHLDPYNSLTIAIDLNKLMVPTPPVVALNDDGDPEIIRGEDPNRSVINGMFTSFGDAPDGFSEELKEVTIGAGVEYWYNDLFAARAGCFFEHAQKGGRKFFTLGVGLKYQLLMFDFAYLVPQEQSHPLAETLRFTLGINFIKPPQASNQQSNNIQ